MTTALNICLMADAMASVLQEGFECDGAAMHALFINRVPCNEALANHPTIEVDPAPFKAVGLVGVLNGVLARLGSVKRVAGAWTSPDEPGGAMTFIGFRAVVPSLVPPDVVVLGTPPKGTAVVSLLDHLETVDYSRRTATEVQRAYRMDGVHAVYAWAALNDFSIVNTATLVSAVLAWESLAAIPVVTLPATSTSDRSLSAYLNAQCWETGLCDRVQKRYYRQGLAGIGALAVSVEFGAEQTVKLLDDIRVWAATVGQAVKEV